MESSWKYQDSVSSEIGRLPWRRNETREASRDAGPPARAVEQREALNEALEAVHGALVPFIERLPVAHGTAAQFRISQKIATW
jgi:hypothetical protein